MNNVMHAAQQAKAKLRPKDPDLDLCYVKRHLPPNLIREMILMRKMERVAKNFLLFVLLIAN